MLAFHNPIPEPGGRCRGGGARVGGVRWREETRREALRVAAGCGGEGAWGSGISEERALATVVPSLSRARAEELVNESLELYVWDRIVSDN